MAYVFTPETFALTFAPRLVAMDGIPLREARRRLWSLTKTFILQVLKNGEEIEYPFGSAAYYRKLKGPYFALRIDPVRAREAQHRMARLDAGFARKTL